MLVCTWTFHWLSLNASKKLLKREHVILAKRKQGVHISRCVQRMIISKSMKGYKHNKDS